jgi:hypothetical protein
MKSQECLVVAKKILEGCLNPLGLSVGKHLIFSKKKYNLKSNFTIKDISHSETYAYGKIYTHADYHLTTTRSSFLKSIQLRLRLTPILKASKPVGFQTQLLAVSNEKIWDVDLQTKVTDDSKQFTIYYDEHGQKLLVPRKFWRIEDKSDPCQGSIFFASKKSSLTIHEESKITCWDFHRFAKNHQSKKRLETLIVELNHKTQSCFILRGSEVCVEQFQSC